MFRGLTRYAGCCVAQKFLSNIEAEKSVEVRETDIVEQVLNFVYIKI